jgi:hypothetical protein
MCLLACLSNAYGERADPAYAPGQVLVMLDSTAHEFSDALRSASQSHSNSTGYTVFDSLGKVHSLQSIDASLKSLLTRTLFILRFPGDADIPTVAAAYARVVGVAVAEPNYLLHATAGIPVDGGVGFLAHVGVAQGLLSQTPSPHGSHRLQVLQLSLSDAYPETLRAIRSAMQRDTLWTGISSFDSLMRTLELTWFHIPTVSGVARKDSLSLFLAWRNARDIGEIAKRFRTLPYVMRAVPRPQDALEGTWAE